MERRDCTSRIPKQRLPHLYKLLLLGWLLGACRDATTETALYVTIEFSSTLFMDQLVITGRVGDAPLEPHVLPEQPERLLTSGETFRLLLPSAEDGARAELTIEGLKEGKKVALGAGATELREGDEVDVTVRLEPVPDGEFCLNCATGCCMNGFCTTPTFQTCGTGGIACQACDPDTTDLCSADGVCRCGTGPACEPLGTDRCENGQCKCGTGGPCAPGQECVSGRCVCTPSSCAEGCCTGFNTCAPGNQTDRCGTGGTTCVRCNRRCEAGGVCG